MRKVENHCVQCGLPCLGNACPKRKVKVVYCDLCEDAEAEYSIDGTDYCESCVQFYLQECFDDLTTEEKAKVLNVGLTKIN